MKQPTKKTLKEAIQLLKEENTALATRCTSLQQQLDLANSSSLLSQQLASPPMATGKHST
jgi:prefoldin subunit 5